MRLPEKEVGEWERGKLTFISGGVRSGKSAYAERLLVNQGGGRLVYIASGSNTDAEMAARIVKHRHDRSPYNWITIEQPINLEQVLPLIQSGDLVLWDCVTTWLANELYAGWETDASCIEIPGCMERKEAQLFETIEAIRTKSTHFVIVSNEVLDELPSLSSEVRLYSEILGRIHRQLVEKADTAIEMEYGIAKFWKKEGWA